MAVLVFTMTGITVQAQVQGDANKTALKTEQVNVSGNCDMCKARIEKAARMEGVTKAEWNKNTRIMTVTYNPAVVTLDTVQKRVATSGHDTEKYKADDQVYNNLPACCHYERKK
jgi:copper chaperone CopZ